MFSLLVVIVRHRAIRLELRIDRASMVKGVRVKHTSGYAGQEERERERSLS